MVFSGTGPGAKSVHKNGVLKMSDRGGTFLAKWCSGEDLQNSGLFFGRILLSEAIRHPIFFFDF